jgi:curved DNA-binding protein CbpA
MKSHYVTLGVGVDATEAEIKAAYRRLAFESHPDRHSGDKEKEARFVEIAEAWDVLGDETKRGQYDPGYLEVRQRAERLAALQRSISRFDQIAADLKAVEERHAARAAQRVAEAEEFVRQSEAKYAEILAMMKTTQGGTAHAQGKRKR